MAYVLSTAHRTTMSKMPKARAVNTIQRSTDRKGCRLRLLLNEDGSVEFSAIKVISFLPLFFEVISRV